MSQTVIHAEGLGKRYRIGQRERYLALRDVLANSLKAPWRLLGAAARNSSNHQPQHIWALKDVSFDVGEGEVVGIIGRNGAGKTTLLKILARVTRPTEGYAEIRGRMGSLLEVGTGFHPELTGRENTYLSGAILGMSKREIERKFDEIVAFAEVEKFIDTPLKHYSSGMQVRLAFAVAAHLEPEILLVDEVLAVGDAAFQKKCLGKMSDVAKAGRTILFVSHNMGAIGHLCQRAILIQDGRLKMDGPARDVIGVYLLEGADMQAEHRWDPIESAPGDDLVKLRAVRILTEKGAASTTLFFHESFRIQLEYTVGRPMENLWLGIHIMTLEGIVVFSGVHHHKDGGAQGEFPRTYISECTVPARVLNQGQYNIRVGSEIPHVTIPFFEENALQFEVSLSGETIRGYWNSLPGLVSMPLEWETRLVSQTSDGVCGEKDRLI
jgi:lipopolysaccharide transport system ATP-binding protein